MKYFVALFITSSFIIAKTGSIEGFVKEGDSPLIGANVYLEKTLLGATTDSLGNYSIQNIPFGKYVLKANYMGYEPSELELYIASKGINSEDRLA